MKQRQNANSKILNLLLPRIEGADLAADRRQASNKQRAKGCGRVARGLSFVAEKRGHERKKIYIDCANLVFMYGT